MLPPVLLLLLLPPPLPPSPPPPPPSLPPPFLALRHIIRQKTRGKLWDNQHDKVEMCHLPVSFCFTVDPDLLEPLD